MIAVATRYAMGTFLSVRVEGEAEPALAARESIFSTIRRLEGLLSVYREDSEICRINRAAGGAPIRIAAEAYVAVALALRFALRTGGAFDPTILPLSRAWKSGKPPCERELRRLRALVDHRLVELDARGSTARLPLPGMGLDLGGIGKGFALDRALVEVRGAPGLRRIDMDFGGQLVFWSAAADARSCVAVEEARAPGRTAESFEVRGNCSVSTSSQAERPGHLVDPRSGLPPAEVSSVTVVADTATEAEAWSTALFLAGPIPAPPDGLRVFYQI